MCVNHIITSHRTYRTDRSFVSPDRREQNRPKLQQIILEGQGSWWKKGTSIPSPPTVIPSIRSVGCDPLSRVTLHPWRTYPNRVACLSCLRVAKPIHWSTELVGNRDVTSVSLFDRFLIDWPVVLLWVYRQLSKWQKRGEEGQEGVESSELTRFKT